MKILLGLFAIGLTFNCLAGQKKSPTVLEVGKKTYTLDEFEFVYNKNNQLSKNPLTPEEYLDLFKNYKLKVIEAEQQGYDQKESFTKEFNFYRDELAKPYLTDKRAEEQVLTEAYERLKYEVDASHILVRFPQQTPTPADTVKAWERIQELKSMIDKGEPFEEVALKYSEDPSAKQNKGRLGYFTGFQMVYPFETAAYTTAVGTISNVVRTSFGYHLIKVHDKKEASGELLVMHIMKMFPYNSTGEQEQKAKASIDSIYNLVKQGADFETLARELSDDKQSAEDNGKLPWFSYGRMIPEFAKPAFALSNNGDVSTPIKTPFGWHIIKRVDQRNLASFEAMKEEIKGRIGSDERAFAGQNAVVARLKKQYQFESYPDNLSSIYELLKPENQTDSMFYASTIPTDVSVCKFAGKSFNPTDFKQYLQAQNWHVKSKAETEIDAQFDKFCQAKLIEHEKENLLTTQPEYNFLVTEYHDGLLIFDISQVEIWNKASVDSAGLETFFKARQSSYPKPEFWDGKIYYCANDSVLDLLNKSLDALKTDKGDSIFSTLGFTNKEVKVERKNIVKGANKLVDQEVWGVQSDKVTYPKGFTKAILIGSVFPPTLYELKEIKGQVLSDYQTEIEKQWLETLKSKYKPKTNYKALKKMKTVKSN